MRHIKVIVTQTWHIHGPANISSAIRKAMDNVEKMEPSNVEITAYDVIEDDEESP